MVVVLDTISDKRSRHPEKAHRADAPIVKKPDCIRVKAPVSKGYIETQRIVRDNGLHTVCEEAACRKDCSATPRGLIGDHIVERKDGGADFDPLNVRLLCAACHNRKTARERTRRGLQAV